MEPALTPRVSGINGAESAAFKGGVHHMSSKGSQERVGWTRPRTRGCGRCPQGMPCLLTPKLHRNLCLSLTSSCVSAPKHSPNPVCAGATVPGSVPRATATGPPPRSTPAAQIAQHCSEKLWLQRDKGLALRGVKTQLCWSLKSVPKSRQSPKETGHPQAITIR